MHKPSKQFNAQKPRAWLRMSRAQYERARPWKKCNLSRAEFDRIALALSQEIVAELHEHATVGILVDAIFKQGRGRDL